MENTTKLDNKIFIEAFAGVILLIISIAISFTGFNSHTVAQPLNLLLAATTGLSATTMLTNAIRKDKHRIV